MERLLVIGFDEPEMRDLRRRLATPAVHAELLPRIQVDGGRLLVEDRDGPGDFVPVSRVIFHGIFEEDFPFLCALALWGGPCLPRARGMLDARLRLPCLVRALEVTRFGTLPRGYADRNTAVHREADAVAKWGEWHCGENKERFRGPWQCAVPTLLGPFVEGESVRVHLMGDRAWQIRLAGPGWKKSLHGPGAGFMDVDPDLLDDSRRLQRHFGLEVLAMDYLVAAEGAKHLLEVNHIPNVTEFGETREAYLDWAAAWARG